MLEHSDLRNTYELEWLEASREVLIQELNLFLLDYSWWIVPPESRLVENEFILEDDE
ncbi:MAG: hypothetical protein OXG88_03750 [Gammaproteobacteria bacterium]|nr:hypothetical protein [Gammaproteobacteria bacterium]